MIKFEIEETKIKKNIGSDNDGSVNIYSSICEEYDEITYVCTFFLKDWLI
jgi:hypothetical protein